MEGLEFICCYRQGQNKRLSPSQKFIRVKNCCLCCLALVYFYFVSWFLLVNFFVSAISFCKKKKIHWLQIVLMTSFTLLLFTSEKIKLNLFLPQPKKGSWNTRYKLWWYQNQTLLRVNIFTLWTWQELVTKSYGFEDY